MNIKWEKDIYQVRGKIEFQTSYLKSSLISLMLLILTVLSTSAIHAQSAKNGPRPGKYLIYGYATSVGAYNGYFMLTPGNHYEVFMPGGKSTGKGTYSFDKATSTVKWLSGPFASKDWDGTQKFEVEREGKTHIIRLKARTIGTNSIDSK